MVSALILSAPVPFSDHFHGLDGTTERILELVESIGIDVRVETELDRTIEALPTIDLLITNCAGPSAEAEEQEGEFGRALDAHASRGGGVLAMHSSMMAFQRVPEWNRMLGGRWNVGKSFHPPIGRHLVQVQEHPVTDGIEDFTIFDERYTDLILDETASPLVTHIDNGVKHTLAWAADGRSRAVYDGLGHGTESYDYPAHRQLIRNSIGWLTAAR
jgi:type 1 glutamine amidotransferase